MKKSALSLTLAVTLIVLGAFAMGERRFDDAYFTISDNPGICQSFDPLPANCIAWQEGSICSVPVGQFTKTYYQDFNCSVPYYRLSK